MYASMQDYAPQGDYYDEEMPMPLELPDPYEKPLPTTDEHLHWSAEAVLSRPDSAKPGERRDVSENFARNQERKLAGLVNDRKAMRLPPMLNELALFTRAATYGDTADLYYHSPSDRIASNYAKAAAMNPESATKAFSSPRKLQEDQLTSTIRGEKGEEFDALALAEIEQLSWLPPHFTAEQRKSISDAIVRYYWYIENGVKDDAVAPLKEEWPVHVMQLVPSEPPRNVSQEYYYNLIEDSMKEMESDYVFSMKKAIVDYTLCNPFERQRLDLQVLEPLVHPPQPQQLQRGDLPDEWGIAVDQARENIAWTLQTLSPNALELSALWESFQSKLLVDVTGPDFHAQLPMELESFQAFQSDVCERTKASLWTVWVPKSAEVFRRTPPLYINGDAEAYYMSIAILQCNQIRSLVQDSMDAYQKFMDQHLLAEAALSPDPQQDTLPWSVKPAFVVELLVNGTEYMFQPTFKEFEEMVVTVLEQFVTAVSGIPRVGSASNAPSRRGMHIPAVGLNEDCVYLVRNKTRSILQLNAEPPRKLAQLYDKFMYLLSMNKEQELKAFQDGEHTLTEYSAEIDKYKAAAEAIQDTSLDEVRTGLYVVKVGNLKEALIASALDMAARLIDQVREAAQASNQVICESYALMSTEVMRVPTTGEEVLILKKYISKCRVDHDALQQEIKENKLREDFLFKYCTDMPEADFNLAYHAYEWPKKMVVIITDATDKANTEHRGFEDALKQRRTAFNETLVQYEAAIVALEVCGDKEARDKFAQQTTDLNEKLRLAQEEADDINGQEVLFGWPKTKFGQIAQMVNKLDPFLSLWNICSTFHASYAVWMNGPFSRLDPEEIETEVGEMFRKIYKLCKFFSGASGAPELPEPLKVANSTREKIDKFRVYLPLITSICNPGLRERHWAQMSELVGFELKRDDHTSLSRLLDRRVDEHMARLQELSDFASREYSFEKMLDKMQADWQGLAFELAPWKETGTFILKGGPVDEAQALLDDHIVKSQAISASPFAKPFEERIIPWERKLVRLQDILDQWLKCQGKWLYLEPIFGSDEIMNQIPKEGAAFRDMDRTWRLIMKKTNENPDMLAVAEMESLLEDLQAANASLDIVEKGLNDFLDTKKMAFPRFYFLSNDELLEILSEAKDPKKIQPFARKIFEAIKEFGMEGQNLMTSMHSVDGEKVDFVKVVDPHQSNAVEVWLNELEAAMMEALRRLVGAALNAYATTARTKWLLEWPGQLVLCCSQTYWTKEITEALKESGAEGLKKYGEKCTAQLADIVELVRGDLTKLERATIGALVVIDVHARDITEEMGNDGVSSNTDFKWLAQLRYYFEEDQLVVRMINAQAYYGYEYLGNSSRLVITPLTDRCYRTLMGAIHLYLGGAPAGPAGTGKTETTKDLSKAIAINCIVFNCSDGLDYKAMGKFFKGLASSGAWACFDEFNRIELEVLSVVAQQVLTIQRGLALKADRIMFEGVDIRLRHTCNAFITMNPGYAGRSELPDNLKALFRDVAMMVPDYALISAITLYSFGYMKAEAMALKLVMTYRLCSEQLSSQDHYDYGMRAVISVLRAAGNLKRTFKDEHEDVLMLRAITDVNKPKFLDQDVPLFNGILGDLFPGVVLPEADYNNLTKYLDENCEKNNLQPLPSFYEKIIQLYEMIIVRHGLMLVGESFGMKTSAYRMLAAALTDLNKAGLNDEQNTKFYVLNPKAITMGQLYGSEDPVSKEWQDGILAVTFRNAARDTSPDRKWVMFDGPVDAIWIENMNTVLDDNKKLCLNSGEIIAMQGLMNMIFEVQDLAVASPATVSRCGMVYVQASLLGWKPVVTSWMKELPPAFTDAYKDHIMAMCEWLVQPMARIAIKECKMMQPMQELNLVSSMLRLYRCLLSEFDDPKWLEGKNENMVLVYLDSLYLFSLVWSIGGDTDEEGRKKFDRILRKVLVGDVPPELKPFMKGPQQKVTQLFPEGKLVYDFTFDKGTNKWIPWLEMVAPETVSPDLEYTKIIVQTIDTIRYTFLTQTLIEKHKHMLLVGPTGTGKTVYIKGYLMEKMDGEQFSYAAFTFSAQTSANMTQDIIDGKLDKRRKGIYGPPMGKRMVIFVDDLNMPQVETYGAQPPIELLRQWMDHGGWYDRKELSFRQLVDMQMVAAMGPPGGGRNNVTNRYLRHYSIISVTSFDTDSLTRVFTVLADWWIVKNDYGTNISRLRAPMVSASIEIYETVQEQLLPTPTKSHYTFNLRDLSKVFQGVTYAKSAVDDAGELTRLWVHEIMRVFHDRLTDEPDREWLVQNIAKIVEKHFKERFGKVMQRLDANKNDVVDRDELRRLMFGDFMIPGADPQVYDEILDGEKMLEICKEYLVDFNATSKKPMDLVLFLYALEHLSRICRIIKQSGGHALLVGVGGSGRQSLTRLSAFMEEYEVFQIEISKSYGINEWREDLKKLMKIAGEQDKAVCFLFNDTQIKEERYVEDISSLLNTSDIPNLIESGDQVQIFENIQGRAKQNGIDRGSKNAMYQFFIDEVKKNLHIVLAFSPVGDAFRERLRKFPALVNCCTIDWFTPWPADALATVAQSFLAELEMTVPKDVLSGVMEMCVNMHTSATELSTRFYDEARRYNYVTPTSYLELIRGFKLVLRVKQTENEQLSKRYLVGLEKLVSTEEQVAGMQEELEALQPQLIQSGKETDEAMVVIARETAEADKVKVVVAKEEAIASAEAAKVQAIKDDCEGQLAEAMPMLESAIKALDTLTKNDITEVKGMKSPPKPVKLVLEAVCIIKGLKPTRVKDAQSGKMVDDYWETSKKMLSDSEFLGSLRTFDKDNIPPAVVQKIRPYVANPDFDPVKIKQASTAAFGLCSWVRAMEAYDRVAKVVAPKKAALAEAEEALGKVMAALAVKQAELKEVEDKLAALDADLKIKQDNKARLEADVEMCSVKLDRATKLIDGLGGEKVRWTQTANTLKEAYPAITGDVLVSSGVIAYLTPFNSVYREPQIESWIKVLNDRGIPSSGEDYSLGKVLGEPVKIRAWNIQGLPKDEFSTENAICMANARRWPLCIDPTSTTNKWIRNMEKEHGLQVMKLTDGDYMRVMENSVQFGKPVLLENILEVVDASLEPLLQRQTFKQGGAMCIRLGDATVEYHDDFRFYITTKMRNPHYPPELCTKVTLLNFMITMEGLEDQLLGLVVAKERPDLEEEKNQLIIQGAENKRQLKEIEDKILHVLSASEGNILEDEEAVKILSASKVLSDQIAEKQKIAEVTEVKIDEARIGYQPVAKHSSLLFFCVQDMAAIDPMYQYSLQWFSALFEKAIADSTKSDDLEKRLQFLSDYFTHFLYVNVCRSLFEKDKMLFAFVLASKLQIARGNLDQQELRFLLTGGVGMDNPHENPDPEWISDKAWAEICRLSDFAFANGMREDFMADPEKFKPLYNNAEAHLTPLPSPWQETLNIFQRMLVVRALRPDKVVPAATMYVEKTMGKKYVEPMPFDLASCFPDSSRSTPLIFVLSQGTDPMAGVLKFAESLKMRVESVSLGQGQGPVALKIVKEAMTGGHWVMLQNCHLAKSFMTDLERTCEVDIKAPDVHRDFRLWMTSYPSPIFPLTVLENGVKMVNEAPKGLRASLLRIYSSDPVSDPDFFYNCTKEAEWRKLLFGLAFFHASLNERRKYGPIGFNIPYEFNENDLRITMRQLQMFLDENDEVPYDTINYTAGECNYGGKVTDGKDRVCLMTILKDYYCPQILDDEYRFSPSGIYKAPEKTDYKGYLDFINTLPLTSQPEVYGLHENADITKDIKDTNLLLDTIMLTQSKVGGGGGGGKSAEEILYDTVSEILERMPPNFDIEIVAMKYPQDYYDSNNTVLVQELARVNNLVTVIRNSLVDIKKAVKGLILLSQALDEAGQSIGFNKVPAMWLKKSFPSLKPLGSYMKEVLERADFFKDWVDNGPPVVYWLPGFFFTQAFLTAAKQNFARKCKIEIDKIDFDFEVYDDPETTKERPEDGVFAKGLYFDGASWDYDNHVLCECPPKILFIPVPTIWIYPKEASKLKKFPHYVCPMYKTADRRGILSTTGHSTNFVMDVRLPCIQDASHWTKRGLGMLTSLSD